MNLKNIALQQAAPILVALGMLFVVVTGGIDLSVGSVMAFGASFTAILIKNMNVPFLLAILAAMVLSMAMGCFTGVLVAYAKMQGFVASLAMMTIARGIAFVITNGMPITVGAGNLDQLVSGKLGYPIIWITILMIFIFAFINKYTSFGRIVIAIGSNETAVELAGIRVKKYLVAVYSLSGVMAALAGVFVAARTVTGSATIGNGQELDAITACVIGGASLSGGKGSVVKSVVGALVLALIGNIMNLMSVPSYPQDIIKGFIIIGAVLLQLTMEKSEKTI
ncbi:ABC transporter permease [Lachnospiraceae bacterium LCP19S3_B12]